MHELQLSSANTGWAPVFLQTNEITFPQHCTRAAEGRRGNGERRLSSGEGGRRRWDGGKRWSTCFADFSPRSTFKSAHSMRRRISSRRRLECETERATGFIIEIAGFRAISRGSRTSTFQMFRVQPCYLAELRNSARMHRDTFVSCLIRNDASESCFPSWKQEIFNPSCRSTNGRGKGNTIGCYLWRFSRNRKAHSRRTESSVKYSKNCTIDTMFLCCEEVMF